MEGSTNKLLVVADDVNFQRGSGPKVSHAMVKLLAELDHPLTLLHQSDQEVPFEEKNVESIYVKEGRSIHYYKSRFNRKARKYLKSDFSKKYEEGTGHSYTEDSLIDSMHKVLSGLNPKDFSLVLTLSKGALFTAHKAILQLPEWHSRWCSYFHDPFPFSWYPEPYTFNDIGTLVKQQLCRGFVENAAVLMFPSLKLMEHYQALTISIEQKSVIVPHVFDPQGVSGLAEFDFGTGGINYLHAGALLGERNPRGLVSAFAKANKLKPYHHLHIVGPYQAHQEFIDQKNLEFPWLHVHGSVDYNTAQSMAKTADVNLIIEAIAPSSPFLPGKFPVLLAMGKPILHIGPANSESMRLLGPDYNLHVENGDEQGLESLLADIETQMSIATQSLQKSDVIDYFSKETILATWEDVIARLQESNFQNQQSYS